MAIPAYHEQEMARYHREVQERESAPLADRREAKADWTSLLKDAEALAVRCNLLLNGSYGYAQHFLAMRIVENKRMNRVAGIGQLVALWECQCPQREAIAAWKSLTDGERAAADAAVLSEIEWREKQDAEERERQAAAV